MCVCLCREIETTSTVLTLNVCLQNNFYRINTAGRGVVKVNTNKLIGATCNILLMENSFIEVKLVLCTLCTGLMSGLHHTV